jgi:hypothetical protein
MVKDSSRKAGILGQGFKPPNGVMSQHLRPRILGSHPKNHPTRKETGHPALDSLIGSGIGHLIGQSAIFSLPPLVDGGETAQVTGRANKAWAVAHVVSACGPTDESSCRWG